MNIIPVIRDSYIKRDGTAPLYLQLFLMKRKVAVPVGFAINPDNWDYDRKIVKGNSQISKDLNLILKQSIGKANDILIKYRLMDKELTPGQFKDEYNNPSVYVDFFDWMEKEILDRKGSILSNGTVKHQLSVLHHDLKVFRNNLTFSEIDETIADQYIKFIKRRYENIGTQKSKIKVFKTYVNLALKRDLIRKNPFIGYKTISEKSNPEFLTEDELQILFTLYRTGNLDHANNTILRHFLFSCMTGLRISDLKSITHEQIINGTLVLYPAKTRRSKKQLVKIPLSKSALKLIKHENKHRLYGTVFNTYADQTMNKRLKKIASIAEIDKNITTHVARHTFATTFLRHNPGDVATLKELMGHSKIEQTIVYVHITDDVKVERMKVFDNYL